MIYYFPNIQAIIMNIIYIYIILDHAIKSKLKKINPGKYKDFFANYCWLSIIVACIFEKEYL